MENSFIEDSNDIQNKNIMNDYLSNNIQYKDNNYDQKNK